MWLVVGTLAGLCLLEALFRMLPVSMGLHRTEQFERWPLQGYQPDQRYTYSRGWQMVNVHHGTTNNYGHIAPFEYRKGSRPVIVVGDSYVESLMNEYADTLQGQLGERLGSRKSVYGLGYSGLSAADYLAESGQAARDFAPAAAVFVIFDGDISESLQPRPGYYHFEPEGHSFRLLYRPLYGKTWLTSIRGVIGDISLYRYIFGNLGFSFNTVFRSGRDKDAPIERPTGQEAERQRQVVDYFLAQLPGALGLAAPCIAFVADSDRYALYDPKLTSAPKEAPGVRQYFLERARELGFAVADLGPVFRARYARDRRKFDYWPDDRHWNRVGHGVAADEAYHLLFSGGRRECLPGAR